MEKNLFLILLIFIIVNLSINVNAKEICNLSIFINEDPLIFETGVMDNNLADISGKRITNPIDKENQGSRPKVYLIIEGEASGNMILDNELPGCQYLYMIVWPDGTTDFQIYNPYTGDISYPCDTNYPIKI